MLKQLGEYLFAFEDTCNVYIVKNKTSAVLIDFGSGDVLNHLSEMGIERVAAVLMTHHHRDNAHGLARTVEAGIATYAPHFERHLFSDVDQHWQQRNVDDNYNVRQDRFSLLYSVPLTGTLEDYTRHIIDDQTFEIVPTPGHTPGSITILTWLAGELLAFTGDLIAAPGKVGSLAATQWTYMGLEGVMSSMLSLLDLAERQPDLLLPSRGVVMRDPQTAIDLLVKRLKVLLHLHKAHPRAMPYLLEHYPRPYRAITPHLLFNTLSLANTYLVLSKSGKAIMFDFGYDMFTGLADGTDLGSRRPWAYSLRSLKRDFGVERIDVLMPTHYHDDHVAGFNLIRRMEGAQVWVADTFAPILENPQHYDLPCLWYEPILVDRRLPLETPIQWEEYTLTLHALPGHTRYAVAIFLEVDGNRVLITGDQYTSASGNCEHPNPSYVYANRFAADDFVRSAALYRRLAPDLILFGHCDPLWTSPDYFERLDALGAATEQIHQDLLMDNAPNDDVLVSIMPYQVVTEPGNTFEVEIEVSNPYPFTTQAHMLLVLPPGLSIPQVQRTDKTLVLPLDALAAGSVKLTLLAAHDFQARRARISVNLTLNGKRFGPQGEALVSAAQSNKELR